MHEVKRANRLSHALVHLVIDRASLVTDPKISGLQIRAKYRHFRSLETNPIDNAKPCFPHDNIVGNRLGDGGMRSRVLSVCHMLWSIFLIDRASLFTDHRISGPPIRAKYKYFRTI